MHLLFTYIQQHNTASGKRFRRRYNPNEWGSSILTIRHNVLCLGMSYPCVESVINNYNLRNSNGRLRKQKLNQTIFNSAPSVERSVELVRRNLLNEIDGRDLARVVALEANNDILAYTVSIEEGAFYDQRHLHANFNRSTLVSQMHKRWGDTVRFRQVILDYFWSPSGSWAMKHWQRSFFHDNIPRMVTDNLLNYGDLKNDTTFVSALEESNVEDNYISSTAAVVYLPFGSHCLSQVVACYDKLSQYYTIGFLRKDQLDEHTLWKATNTICAESMRGWLSKNINQEEQYCKLDARQIKCGTGDSSVTTEEILNVFNRIDRADEVRMIKLTALRKFHPNFKSHMLGSKPSLGMDKGGYVGLKRAVTSLPYQSSLFSDASGEEWYENDSDAFASDEDSIGSGDDSDSDFGAPKQRKKSSKGKKNEVPSVAKKCVSVVAHVLNSNKSLKELRTARIDDIKDIVRPTLTFGNQYWTHIKILLHKAIAAKEKGKTIDNNSLLRMFYASNPNTKPKTSEIKVPFVVTKCVSVVELVMKSNKSFTELRNLGKGDVRNIVRPTLGFADTFWKQIRVLLHKAIAAKEEGKTVDNDTLLLMFYASNPETKATQMKKASSSSTTSRSTCVSTTMEVAAEAKRKKKSLPTTAPKEGNHPFEKKRAPPTSFEQKVEQLQAHKAKYGHFNIKKVRDGSNALYNFCNAVRSSYRYPNKDYHRIELTEHRIALLDSIGFDWKKESLSGSTSTTSTDSSQPAPRKQTAKQQTNKQLPRKRSLSRQHSNEHTNRKKMNRVDSITTDSGQPSSQSSSMTSEPRQDEPNSLALEWDRILTSFEEEYAKRNNLNDTEVPMDDTTDVSSQQAMSLQSLESTDQPTTTSLTTQSTTKPPSEEQVIPVRTTQLQCSQYPLATVKMAKLRHSRPPTYNDDDKEAETETTTAELLSNNADMESSLNMNDVLMGADYNSHPGNIQFFMALSMFDDFSEVSDCFVSALKSLDPPGRFMGKDKLNDCWESLDYETGIELVPYLADSYTQNSNDGDECSSAFLVSVQQFFEAKQEGGTDSNGSISELTDPTYQKSVLPQTSPIPREVKCSPIRSSTSKQLRKMPTSRIGTSPRSDRMKKKKTTHHQMFEAVVPDGVSPGQTFSLLADGQRVSLICPQTAKPGGKVRFRLPIPEIGSAAATPKKADTFEVASRALASARHSPAPKRKRVAEKGKSLALSAALAECEGKNEVTDSSTRDSISYETYAEA